jgi:DNA-binding beta-propeller fold protein YncE
MTLSPDGIWAYILDERGHYLIRMDLRSGSLAGRVRLGNRPEYVIYLPDHQRLAVSMALSQTVFLLNPEDLTIMETVSVGSSPQGLLVMRAWPVVTFIGLRHSATSTDIMLQ